ncbi:bifunctional glutamate N-acetyltransferase/amino-acid acetyltransferase ArgJ [Ferroacidibacillus organovorans]|uniref:Arginine biosynthesis bifunctional protein ArgJ n=1 Tax=Ferroacidibacillus organovorans TaxID=1765683 RepID=A0A1V4EXQ5_9BACL|nr:bifunctional glutamate N-acetyltransferase/amino-acid acetyltransferase ArgJ [Ferroacidibacillus organovorans]OPG17671.1 bifunctional ornithine acetyltransferase/N-acetylglutamate synthase [Ferroacidibacillus organovorans]
MAAMEMGDHATFEQYLEKGSVTFSSGRIGIKRDGDDAALFVFSEHAVYAGAFTTNAFKSACVTSAMDRLRAQKKIKAVLITSGNANAGTGPAGRADTERLAAGVAGHVGCAADEVVVLHTGVIGVPLRAERLIGSLEGLCQLAASTPEKLVGAARAMMTTDTFPKVSARAFQVGDTSYTVWGVAKGAGMIHPKLATMLSVLVTDAPVSQRTLQRVLSRVVGQTFNRISVDGDTSPNDSVLLFSTGGARMEAGTAEFYGAVDETIFEDALKSVAQDLAHSIVRDGEGATKFLEIVVRGVQSEADAERIAETIATSPLVKTAFFGEDFNPGRIISAIGRAGVAVSFDRLRLTLGDQRVYDAGQFLVTAESDARRVMAMKEIPVVVELGAGELEIRYWTCDLTFDYVKINAEYTT